MKKLTKAAAITKSAKASKATKATKVTKGNGTSKGNGRSDTKADAPSFLHVAMAKRSREGLNKLVNVMGVPGQRQVLEQLIADELHRRGMRLPRA